MGRSPRGIGPPVSAVVNDTGDSGPVLSNEERSAQFKQGPPKLPRKVIWIAIGILAVLGIGGAYADQSFNVPPTSPPTHKAHDAKKVPLSIAQFMDLRALADRPAPAIDLADQSGRPLSLAELKGKAVAISFLDPRCHDICPVESAEIRDAVTDLGSKRAEVAFVIVDANPNDVGAGASREGLVTDGLSSLPDAYFVSGTLQQLNRVWTAYGVTVEYAPSTGQLGHTNLIDIIDPSGRLDYSLEPFGNELPSGTYTLSNAQIRKFASGIATYLERVLR
jgi:cytochrome oxidase Cu insertion factor (SCO1/SenC/PrrC family)